MGEQAPKPRMNFVPKVAQENPIKFAASTIGALSIIVTSAFAIDGRYAHSTDTDNKIQQIQEQTNRSIDYLRKSQIEDKLFEIDLKKGNKGQLSNTDQALRNRYQQQLDEIMQRRAEFKDQSK